MIAVNYNFTEKAIEKANSTTSNSPALYGNKTNKM